MDDRIKELAEQFNLEISPSYPDHNQKVLEKFAELMVNHAVECVRDVLRDENCDLTYDGARQVQERLREYFGVKE